MSRMWLCAVSLAILCALSLPTFGQTFSRILFDTDMESDCDDAACLAMLHALADRGEIELLGTMISAKFPWSGPCADAINTYYGRPDLPIGVPKGKAGIQQGSKYAEQVAKQFPHDCPLYDDAPDATRLYRQLLAAQPDGSVTILTVGDLTNLRYLIESEADEISPLTGQQLVKKKVAHWVCMGSRYPADLDPGKWGNFKPDAESTVKAIEAWPTKITFTGGGKFAELISTGKRLKELPQDNPVRRVYELYFGGNVKDRHSADQIAVMVAARGTGHPWKLVTQGHNHIFPNGTHQWEVETDNPRHQYISALADGVDPQEVIDSFNELMLHQPK
ncbi:Inosine-uridine preferring nucleoside hydrolase [Bremerella volcania]|uniref:Inosine-uridine preferring nucleoside hydrolase n=2 Tax=Bremerella volcania TaxID=2527984 RepID=A0A518C1D1_9BACT|nr:Inosine-uridine preferring nucleoside hydrolase [Bremerella volcania]